ncbi:MAG: segregation/condensation protein A [Candidatus Dormibacteraeota bacterium]|nr:segregation/condensation protein A [Candidatus Dormibacteraeota bacterium]
MDPAAPGRPRLDVAVPVFEGPLELLLALVERHELDVLEVPLAALTDAYLGAIADLDRRDPQEMADFLWLASRLLLLKSIRLLPGEETQPAEAELLDWEEDVRRRLFEYRAYKAVADELMARAVAGETSFEPPTREVPGAGQEQPLEVEALVLAFQSVIARLPPRPLVYTGHGWTMEEKMDAVRSRLRRGPFDLVDLILESADRLEAVVTFVAILELLRRSEIRVRQRQAFGPVWVEAAT